MKALVLTGTASPSGKSNYQASATWTQPKLQIMDVPEPQLQGPYSTLIETTVCGICGSDLHCSETGSDGFVKFGGPAKLPVILGHEFAGRVVAVGAACKTLRTGDLVTSESIVACWNCAECANGQLNDCRNIGLLGLTQNGAFAAYVCVDSRHCYLLNELLREFNIDEACELGSLLEPLGVAYRALLLRAKLVAGETVAIFGLGPIGLSVGLLAIEFGARQVVGFDPSPERMELARSFGVSAYPTSPAGAQPLVREMIREAFSGQCADISVEAAGESQAFYDALSAVRAGGRLLLLGRLPAAITLDTNYIMSNSINIVGSRGHAGDLIFPKLIKLIAARRIAPGKMITHRTKFSAILTAFDRARARLDCKVQVRIGSE